LNLAGHPEKQVGPNHGWSSTWILATFCFFLLLLVQMTLVLPTILYSTIKTFIKIVDATAYAAEYIEQDLSGKLISWFSFSSSRQSLPGYPVVI
jgi:hypothetical protein